MSNDKRKKIYEHVPKTPAPIGNKHVPKTPAPQNNSRSRGNGKK